MPNVHTRYVTWISRGKRHHGSAAMDITMPTDSILQPGGDYQPWAASQISWNDSNGQHTGYFAFWSFTGTSDGSLVSTEASPKVNVGSDPITAIAWYIPGGGRGNGQGLFIDAFDVDIGNFVDDDFVTVAPDGNLTSAANNDGFVPTTSVEDVKAFNAVHGGVPFDKWLSIGGAETIQGQDLKTKVNTSDIDFAFYLTPKKSNFTVVGRNFAEWTWVSYGVMVDGGGPTGHGPVDPGPDQIRQYAAGLALNNLAQHLAPNLRKPAVELATTQINLAGKQLAAKTQQR